jgi:hypothetical protein
MSGAIPLLHLYAFITRTGTNVRFLFVYIRAWLKNRWMFKETILAVSLGNN